MNFYFLQDAATQGGGSMMPMLILPLALVLSRSICKGLKLVSHTF